VIALQVETTDVFHPAGREHRFQGRHDRGEVGGCGKKAVGSENRRPGQGNPEIDQMNDAAVLGDEAIAFR